MSTSLDLLAYIKSLWNNQTLSDFMLVDKDGKKVYLHKLIMYNNPFFKMFFESTVGTDKSKMKVDNIGLVEPLTMFFYTGNFFMPEKINPDDFISLCDLVEMWYLTKTNIMFYMFKYLYNHLGDILDHDISYGESLLRYFGNHPNIRVTGTPNKFYPGGQANDWNGTYLKRNILAYWAKNGDQITSEMTALSLFNELDPHIRVTVLMRLGLYNKIHLDDAVHMCGNLSKYYDPKSKVFTPKQLSALKTCRHIGNLNSHLPYSSKDDKTLHLGSLVPFSGKIYHYIGDVTGKSTKFTSVFVNLKSDFKTTLIKDGIYDKKFLIDGQLYTIKSIYLNGDSITDGECFQGNEYSFGLLESNLPERSKSVFWVEDL